MGVQIDTSRENGVVLLDLVPELRIDDVVATTMQTTEADLGSDGFNRALTDGQARGQPLTGGVG